VNVNVGQYSSGKIENSGPLQCKDDDSMNAGKSPRDARLAEFSCVGK